ncbi:MAG: DNA mismatch repair protein MutS [Victivallales bacterium]|nr:DNA mismatch repair protein MutS [Victivallales bacterium]
MSGEASLTPMMKQYRLVKAEIPEEAILLFRMGDFYEMFFEDASRAAPLLDIALTKRAGVPMCGVPFHALDNYLPRLLDAGVKVAIAEQMEDPKLAKGIVKRAVTRVITPGTVLDSSVLSPGQNNFLAAACMDKNSWGLACIDISTGDFRLTEVRGQDELEGELKRLDARECLLPESLMKKTPEADLLPGLKKRICLTAMDDWVFSMDSAEELLKRHFNVLSLDGFGCRGMPGGIRSAGAVLRYAAENLRQDASHVRTLKSYHTGEYMVIDDISRRNLELVETISGGTKESTLLGVINHTSTAMGSRLLREWLLRPINRKLEILKRQGAVETLKDNQVSLAEIRELLAPVKDIERLIAKITVRSANARDLRSLAESLRTVPEIKTVLQHHDVPVFCEIRSRMHDCGSLAEEIERTICEDPPLSVSDGGMINSGLDPELDELRKASREGKSWIASMQTQEQQRTGIKSLKIRFNKVFGYYIEISRSNVHLAPESYIRKQTLTNGERYITPELKEVEDKILGAEDKSKALENKIFQKLCEKCLQYTASIQENASAIASLDALQSFATCAVKHNYCRPRIFDDQRLVIADGRHPVLDTTMSNERFVPNDINLDGKEKTMMIITGPNMAGKSTYIRQIALLSLLAHTGSFIPAKSAEIGLIDRIFTRVGASDDISRGQSTFMVEMLEAANILNHATSRSLVVLDEIGRGTSTFDGISIAWAIAEHLHDNPASRARTLFATHYHELTELSLTCKGVSNYNVAVREYGDKIIFLRQILPGISDKSYGIHVAKLAGLPDKVIERANEILENLENNAMAEAGQPALAVSHQKKNAKPPRKTLPHETPNNTHIQPLLFDEI